MKIDSFEIRFHFEHFGAILNAGKSLFFKMVFRALSRVVSHTCTYLRTYVCMYVCMYLCMHYIYIYIYIYICAPVCMWKVFVCVCVCVCVWKLPISWNGQIKEYIPTVMALPFLWILQCRGEAGVLPGQQLVLHNNPPYLVLWREHSSFASERWTNTGSNSLPVIGHSDRLAYRVWCQVLLPMVGEIFGSHWTAAAHSS